jgi:hypothetical protein
VPTTPTAAIADTFLTANVSGNDFNGSPVALPGGGFVVAFASNVVGGSWRPYLQFFDNDGVRVGAPVEVSSTGYGFGYIATVTVLTDGDLMVSWFNGSSLQLQRMEADGTPVGAAFAAPGWESHAVFALADGGFAVAGYWNSTTTRLTIYDSNDAQVAAMTPAGNAIAATQLANGNIVAVFGNAGANNIQGQIYTAAGVAVGPSFDASQFDVGAQYPAITALVDGRFVVAFTEQNAGLTNDVSFRIFNADGTPATDQTTIASAAGRQEAVSLVALNDGGFIVVWHDLAGADGSGEGILGRRYDSAGAPVGTSFVVTSDPAGNEFAARGTTPSTAQLSDGSIAIVFAQQGAGGFDIQFRIFDVDGNPAAPVRAGVGADALVGDAGDNGVIFTAATLGAGDSFDGGDGHDTVTLSGDGTFDLRGVTLTSVEEIATTGDSTVLQLTNRTLLPLISELGGADDRVEFDDFMTGGTLVDTLFDLGDVGAEEVAFDYRAHIVTASFTGGATPGDTSDDRVSITYTDDHRDAVEKYYVSQTKTFDRAGVLREIVTVHDNGRTDTTTYDAAGQRTMLRIEDGPGDVLPYALQQTTYVGGVVSQTVRVGDNGDGTTIDYNALGQRTRLLQEDGDEGTAGDRAVWDSLETTYDAAGRIASKTQVNDAGNAVSEITSLFSAGVLTSKTMEYANGEVRAYSYLGGAIDQTRVTKANGDQVLTGAAGSQTLQAGAGSDQIRGGAGADIFVFTGGANGDDRIMDFQNGTDLLAISGVLSVAELDTIATLSDGRYGLVIDFDDPAAGSITVTGLTLATLDDLDFFVR